VLLLYEKKKEVSRGGERVYGKGVSCAQSWSEETRRGNGTSFTLKKGRQSRSQRKRKKKNEEKGKKARILRKKPLGKRKRGRRLFLPQETPNHPSKEREIIKYIYRGERLIHSFRY